MEVMARADLGGIAIVSFASAVVAANTIAWKALWHFNRLAAEISWVMLNTPFEQITMEQLAYRQKRKRQVLVEIMRTEHKSSDSDSDDENKD